MSKALVTGATRGPGRAIATALVTAGYETYALGRDRVILEELRGDFGVMPMAIDLTDREALRMVVDGMQPDIVVHAALRWPESGHFSQLGEADIDMALEVNISATLHVTRSVLPAMRERGRGAVLLVLPNVGAEATLLERTVAGAGGAFVDALGRELAGSGTLVRAIAAGTSPFQGLKRSILTALDEFGMGLGASQFALHEI